MQLTVQMEACGGCVSLTLTPTGLTVPHVDCFTCVICSKDMSRVSVSANVFSSTLGTCQDS